MRTIKENGGDMDDPDSEYRKYLMDLIGYVPINSDVERLMNLKSLIGENFFTLPKKAQKSETESVRLRELGNSLMRRNAFYAALSMYSQSIAVAPHDPCTASTGLALAYANRGAVLKAIGLFKESISDTERALQAGYLEHLRYKLFTRMGQCYLMLGDTDKALKNLSQSKIAIENSKLDTKDCSDLMEKIEADVQLCANSLGNLVLDEQKHQKLQSLGFPETIPGPIPHLSNKLNPEVLNASDSVAIRYDKTLGRHFVATRDIKPGKYAIHCVQYAYMPH